MPPSSARKRVRAYLRAAAEKYPTTAGISTIQGPAGWQVATLTVPDLRTLLQSERAARAQAKAQRDAAAVQSGKAAEAAAVVARLQEQNTTLRKSLADAGQDEVLYPNTIRALQNTVRVLRAENTDLRNNVSELSRKISDPPGSHERWAELRADRDRWKRTADSRDADLRTLTAERDSLQRALNNLRDSVRKGTPRTYADILREARPENGKWSTDYFLALMQAVAESLKDEKK